jgi:hypothetical protein
MFHYTSYVVTNNQGREAAHVEQNRTLRGLDFCKDHPLYHPMNLKLKEIFEECQL